MPAGPQVMCRKCLSVIQSLTVHHMIWCECEAIAVDGGDARIRCLGNPEDFIWDFEEQNG
jgi:hypothetical protein